MFLWAQFSLSASLSHTVLEPMRHSCLAFPQNLSDFTFTFHFHALEKEMAPHSSVLAWRIPGTAEPGGLLGSCCKLSGGIQGNSYYHQPYCLSSNSSSFHCLNSPPAFTNRQDSPCKTHLSSSLPPCSTLALQGSFLAGRLCIFSSFLQAPLLSEYLVNFYPP